MIEFFSLDKPLNFPYPIEPIGTLKLNWVKDSAIAYKETNTDTSIQTAPHLCSGIKDLMNVGYVVRLPYDVAIKTDGDGISVASMLPNNLIPEIKYFTGKLFGDVLPVPHNTLKTAIKINTRWAVKMPKGWKMLMLPINYQQEQPFTCATGIVDSSICNQINPILYWHGFNGEYILKAGTALCHLIPINTGNMPNMEIRDITPKEIEWNNIYCNYMSNTWSAKSYKKLSDLYNKFFTKPKKCPFHIFNKND